jgi:UDP-GlcNAc:undecaprenyl-phosphate GlcNAc-1-phosphate transferase
MGDFATLALLTFLPALVATAVLVRPAVRIARWSNLVAPVRPDRLHRAERPYGGGIAILLASALAVAFVWAVAPPLEDEIGFPPPSLPRVAMGPTLFFLLGLLDDRFAFGAWLKLVLQLACAAVVVLALRTECTVWLPWPGLSQAVSVLWIVALVNAYNMLDHADGLAGVVGAVALVSLAAGQFFLYQMYVAGAALVVGGALVGFLIYNYPPADLFMGDAGSMLVGYVLAALTMEARYYFPEAGTSKFVVLLPLALLAVPLFDMVCVTLSRIRRKQSPFRGDATSHLAHRMLARGWSPRGIVAFAAGASAVTGAASVAMYLVSGPALVAPWLAVAAVLAAMLWVRRVPHTQAAA